MRSALTEVSPRLVQILEKEGFTPATLQEYLGPAAYSSIARDEPASILYTLRNREAEPLAILIRAFLVHTEVARQQLDRVLTPQIVETLLTLGMAQEKNSLVTIGFDIRSTLIDGRLIWIFSDLDASLVANHIPGKDHVLGIGAASLSLLSATPRTPVHTLLDLGSGSGIQALGQAPHAHTIIATDIHDRALDFAEANSAANKVPLEIRSGSWFDPVAGEKFDRIVANPPFVVGPPEIGHVYRDSGLDLDGATEYVVRKGIDHLKEQGCLHALGSWAYREEESVPARVASWIPETGVSAWFIQRDTVDSIDYINTWLRDESIDPRSNEGAQRTQHWLQHFEHAQVTAIGFRFVAVKRIDDHLPSEVVFEHVSHPIDSYVGDEIQEHFVRMEWLRNKDAEAILDAQYYLRPGVAKEDISTTDIQAGMGFASTVLRLTRTDGLRFSHEVDQHIAAIIAGLHPAGLSLREVAELYAFSNGLEEDSLYTELIQPIVALIQHGIILPADITTGW
ncbi:class I SAM-dependent methyltransferase [Corynebacterium pseudotuberculosis]|uniref:class I SAM-dependent methyltransferase n=1 Tax=Corynebacterium pseudotuberculosis TaxID=1719 RepID=UPI002FFB26CD